MDDIQVPAASSNAAPSAATLHHRKIDLQSHSDLLFLQQNLAKSTREKLDKHLPPMQPAAPPATYISLGGEQTDASKQDSSAKAEDDEDPLRQRVRLLIDAFLQQTWDSASQSIAINGIDASSVPVNPALFPNCSNPMPKPDEASASEGVDAKQEIEGIHFQYSAFDARLQHKVATLHGELELLTAQVSKLRRQAPKQGAEAYISALRDALDQDEKDYEKVQQDIQQQNQSLAENGHVLRVEPTLRDGWTDDVKDIYKHGIDQLAMLSGMTKSTDLEGVASLTETVGKARRAKDVAMEFE